MCTFARNKLHQDTNKAIMTDEVKHSISRMAILGAFLMAISCTAKITVFYLGMPVIAQWINIVMNAIIVVGCYQLGRIVNLPVTHRLLCLVAMLGYVMYSFILALATRSDDNVVSVMVYGFFLLTSFAAIALVIALLFRNIKQQEEIIAELEESTKKNK